MDFLLARFVALWTRARLDPADADAGARLRDSAAPVCYVLERSSAVDLAMLRSLCAHVRLPRPSRRLLPGHAVRASFALERPVETVTAHPGFTPEEQALIVEGNARRLLAL